MSNKFFYFIKKVIPVDTNVYPVVIMLLVNDRYNNPIGVKVIPVEANVYRMHPEAIVLCLFFIHMNTTV